MTKISPGPIRRRGFFCLVMIAVLALWPWPTGYFLLVPGAAPSVRDLVTVPGGGGDGRLLLVTVAARPAGFWLYLFGRFSPGAELVRSEDLIGPGVTPAQYELESRRLMAESLEAAKAAALGEVARRGLRGTGKGGIQAADISVLPDGIAGPSAALPFALEIIDQLTPQDLTGGRAIAATGTLDPNGRVGRVGGLAQKALAAERAGATVLLVPKGDEAVSRRYARRLTVIGVESLGAALDYLGMPSSENGHNSSDFNLAWPGVRHVLWASIPPP